ncbi:hypothetical protein AAHH18_16985, partial [Cellulomonas sp. P4]
GCAWLTVRNAAPVGVVERLSTTPEGVTLSGWALDPDTTAPVQVHVHVDGKAVRSVKADLDRPDVERAYGLGAAHGFNASVAVTGGKHEVCVYAINQPTGPATRLTCRTVEVGNVPVGRVDALTAGADSVTVRGWALDADTRDPISVHVHVDGKPVRSVRAETYRADIDRAYGLGPNHGFSAEVPVAQGKHEVCVYAINVPSGPHKRLTCRTVTVSNDKPLGRLDVVRPAAGGVRVAGWALDPDTAASIRVHVHVDGTPVRSVLADRSRPDVGRAYGLGSAHGFDTTVPAAPGSRQVCVYAINQPAGPNPRLGCTTVTVP